MKKSVTEVIEWKAAEWMAIPDVVGVYNGVGDAGEERIVILVRTPAAVLRDRLPVSVEGYPVVLEDASDLRPM